MTTKRPPPKRRSFVLLVELLIEGLEEELNAAEELGCISVAINRSEVFTLEVLSRCNNVLEERVVRANFPALLVVANTIRRRHDGRVASELTVSNIGAPSALVCSFSALVVVLCLPGVVEVVSFRVLSICAPELAAAVELIASRYRPDVSIVIALLAIVVRRTDLLSVNNTIFAKSAKSIRIQMIVASTSEELARAIIEVDTLDISRISVQRRIKYIICIAYQRLIIKIQTSSKQRRLQLVAELDLCTGELIIEYKTRLVRVEAPSYRA